MNPFAFRRVFAFVLDSLVAVVWGCVLFGVVYLATGGEFFAAGGVLRAEALSFGAMTLPFALYFAVLESGARQATWGKRRFGLKVERLGGGRLSFGAALARALIKFVPWELAHLGLNVTFFGGPALEVWTYVLMIASWLGVFVYAYLLYLNRAMPYDRVVGARVVEGRALGFAN